jgi:hypothetical protein
MASISLSGCEDAPPNDYVPQYVVQGYLVVDSPIRGIGLSRSQPVTDTFKVERGRVPDADVRLITEGRTLQLLYRAGEKGTGEYYYPDTAELVKPGARYTLQITTKDGATLTAQTLTPNHFAWVRPPIARVVIPQKSEPAYMKPPDSLNLVWTPDAGVQEYLVSVRALDTLGYGRYLSPETSEGNERVDPELDEFDERHYNDLTRWGFVASTTTPIVWGAFKWYGPQEVSVYAGDRNLINWFKMTQWTGNPQYDPLLGNIQGGVGVFASASVIRADHFLIKNIR